MTIKDQDEYNYLLREIRKNATDDSRKDSRLKFYKLLLKYPSTNRDFLYKTIITPLIEKLKFDYYFTLSFKEESYLFELLETKRQLDGLNQLYYEYICYLACKYNKHVGFNIPKIPLIEEIGIRKFEDKFCIDDWRKGLFEALKNGILILLSQNLIRKKDHILIGGSFLNLNKYSPQDIDAIFLVDRDLFNCEYDKQEYKKPIRNLLAHHGIGELDLYFLPNDYSQIDYRYNELLALLGNDSEVKNSKEKNSKLYDNNKFTERILFKIGVSEFLKGECG